MARRWHAPRPFAIALTICGIALFATLASWQFRRAHEKVELFAAFAATADALPMSLAQARLEGDAAHYPKVRVNGRYDAGHAWVLDNQVRGGRAGVMLFDLLEPTDGSVALLVNRGFIARDARGEIPAMPPPPQGVQNVIALYAPAPGSGLRIGGNRLPQQQGWPKTSIYIDIGEIAADAGRKLDPRVLLLLPEQGSGFVREWTPEVFPPERHLGYAYTWLTFVLVTLATFVILHWRHSEDLR